MPSKRWKCRFSVPQFKKSSGSIPTDLPNLESVPLTFWDGLTPLFNTTENQNYVGPLPPTSFYHPDGMSPDEKEKFLEWHNGLKENNYVFDFQQEILTYCRSDVDILRRCCLEFRELFRHVTDIDPFEKCLTIASACNLVFRKNFLKENTNAIIPLTVIVRKTNNPSWL